MGLLARLAMDKEEENKKGMAAIVSGQKEDHKNDTYKELKKKILDKGVEKGKITKEDKYLLYTTPRPRDA